MLKDVARAFAIVAVAALIGYEVGVRQWEDQEAEKAVSNVISLNNQLKDIQRWVTEVGPTLTQEEFSRQLSEKMEVINFLARRV